MNFTDWLDPNWLFATTVGDFLAAVAVAGLLGWAVGRLMKDAR